jgi:glycosyltransferase involved in cell wall biosynthesis
VAISIVYDKLFVSEYMEHVQKKVQPDVSVVILTHRRAHLLLRSVTSVLSQTLNTIEIVIVDDVPDEETKKTVSELQEKDRKLTGTERIIPVYLPEPCSQRTVLRNIGIRNTKGRFVAFLDDDDEWMPSKLEKQLALFEADKAVGFVGCGAHYVTAGKVTGTCRIAKRGDVLRDLLEKNILCNGSVAVVRREIFDAGILFDEKMNGSENRELWIQIASAGWKYDFVDEPLVNIHVHETHYDPGRGRRSVYLAYLFDKYASLYISHGMYGRGARIVALYMLTVADYSHTRKYALKAVRHYSFDYRAWGIFLLGLCGPIGLRIYRFFR